MDINWDAIIAIWPVLFFVLGYLCKWMVHMDSEDYAIGMGVVSFVLFAFYVIIYGS